MVCLCRKGEKVSLVHATLEQQREGYDNNNIIVHSFPAASREEECTLM